MTDPKRATVIAGAHWEELLADVDAFASEYEDTGWETVAVHARSAAVLDERSRTDRYGLSVLAPEDEFERAEELVEGGVTFDTSAVYSRRVEDVVLLIVALEDHDREAAIVFPAYYECSDADAMLAEAMDAGTMYTYLTGNSGERVGFEHDEPSIFLPPEIDG